MSLLTIVGVGKRYGPMVALADVGLVVPSGGRTAIVGPSGSGKTTLLRLIAGFEAPDAGRITLEGRLLADGGAIVPAHRRGIGFVPQDGALFPHLTVAGNIGFGLERDVPHRKRRIRELMDLVELEGGMQGRRPHELSGGQQQRVALARALARRPKLMLLDEPFSSLDPGLRDSLRRTVGRVLGAAGVTTILVTHDQAEALSFADHLAILREGRLVQAGPPRELYLHPGDADIAGLLGDALVLQARLGDGWADCSLGRVPADTGSRRGAALIVLRPEQVQLIAIPVDDPAGAGDPAACYGRVIEVEFGGAACTATVSLIGGEGPPGQAPDPGTPLLVRGSSHDLPDAGTRVRITVRGKAHIVEPRATAGDGAPF